MLLAEGGNIVIVDVATNTRRQLVKTASVESNPRWARNDTAVTFMRDGNLYLMSLDGAADTPAEVQLTDVAAPPGEVPAQTATGARGAATGQRGGGGHGRLRGGGDQQLTDSQRLLRQENQNLIEYLKRQAEQRQAGRGGGGGGGRRGGPRAAPVARQARPLSRSHASSHRPARA